MVDRGRAAALIAAGAAGGSLLTLLARAREAKAAAPEGVDQEFWDMLIALIEAITLQTASIDNLVSTLGGTAVAGEDPFANTGRFVTGQVICTALNTGFQLPPFPIPKNKQLVVKALPGNVGWIYLSVTQGQSQSLAVAYMLVPNEGIGLFINNSDQVWVCAPAPPIGALNDGVAFIVEQS